MTMTKQFLNGCFRGTLEHLAEHSFWRDSFKDQLNVLFKNHVVDLTVNEKSKAKQTASYLENIINTYLSKIVEDKKELK